MRIALAQINTTVGDFAGNSELILARLSEARARRAELVVFPELCLCGYPPMDLLDHASFVEENLKALRRIQRAMPAGLGAVIGYVDRNRSGTGKRLVNAASLLADGRLLHTQAKTLLPTYDVFDEARYFEPAAQRRTVEFRGERLGLTICEDLWWETDPDPGGSYAVDPVRDCLDAGATLLLAPLRLPLPPRQAGGAPAAAAGHRRRVRRAGGVRQHGGRQRRPAVRRPVVRHRRRRRVAAAVRRLPGGAGAVGQRGAGHSGGRQRRRLGGTGVRPGNGHRRLPAQDPSRARTRVRLRRHRLGAGGRAGGARPRPRPGHRVLAALDVLVRRQQDRRGAAVRAARRAAAHHRHRGTLRRLRARAGPGVRRRPSGHH